MLSNIFLPSMEETRTFTLSFSLRDACPDTSLGASMPYTWTSPSILHFQSLSCTRTPSFVLRVTYPSYTLPTSGLFWSRVRDLDRDREEEKDRALLIRLPSL